MRLGPCLFAVAPGRKAKRVQSEKLSEISEMW